MTGDNWHYNRMSWDDHKVKKISNFFYSNWKKKHNLMYTEQKYKRPM